MMRWPPPSGALVLLVLSAASLVACGEDEPVDGAEETPWLLDRRDTREIHADTASDPRLDVDVRDTASVVDEGDTDVDTGLDRRWDVDVRDTTAMVDGEDTDIDTGSEGGNTCDVAAGGGQTNGGWTRLIGSSGYDVPSGSAVDGSGNVYVVGRVDNEDLAGVTNGGEGGAFVAKYDPAGNREWVELLGSSENDNARSVSVDGCGNVYVAGLTEGDLAGETNSGEEDGFVAKYDTAGNLKWVELLGAAQGVSVNGCGNVFVVGSIERDFAGESHSGEQDAFVARYDGAGNRKWAELLGTSLSDRAGSVTIDGSGSVYVDGHTQGDLAGETHSDKDYEYESFLAKYDTAGNRQWVELFGTWRNEIVTNSSVDDSGNVYVVGPTEYNAFLAKYDAGGNRKWVELFGSPGGDGAQGVTVDDSGDIYVSGHTVGDLAGEAHIGEWDAVVQSYDTAGNRKWVELFGTSDEDKSRGVSVGDSGNVYVVGSTYGELGGECHAGAEDVFVASIPVP